MNDDEWLLILAAEIVDVSADKWAITNVLEKFVTLFGRLVIKCKKGNTFSRYVCNLSKYLNQATVKEILPCNIVAKILKSMTESIYRITIWLMCSMGK
ncbi:hypothetical protein [uncultured Holdemanella sp.]|uniref:hypothetical protein n=1 Tax=uncultured Holdemanella sp. TaxID=1763549 RepID=UPI002582EA24|nr:hypothetical protein [uncultured Holdemanella sp.]